MEDTPIEITEAAGDWLDRLSGSSPPAGGVGMKSTDERCAQELEAFADWLLRSPVHVAEFLRLSALETGLRRDLGGHAEWAQALLDSSAHNVIDLDGTVESAAAPAEPPLAPTARQRGKRCRWWRWPAAAAVLAGIAFGVWTLRAAIDSTPSAMATVLGEQRSVLLADGSTVTLNTDSEVRIHMTPTVRQLDLAHGEMLVDVAEDPTRPFRVLSGRVVIEALGTRFNVYRRPDATVVTVVEGRVLVDRSESPRSSAMDPALEEAAPVTAGRLELNSGLQATIGPAAQLPELAPADPEQATAWTRRRLVFEYRAVGDVAQQFNRYNRSHLLIVDPVLASRQITGVLDVNDSDAFVALLEGLEPIVVQVTADGHRAISRR